jgi:anti-sigma factor RsiW
MMKCEEIEDLLLDYLTHELGTARAAVVREHLKKCENCRRTAVEIRATVRLLQDAAKADAGVADRLSQVRRTRLIRAFMHPILDWIFRHHLAVSIAVAIVIAGILFCRALAPESQEPPLLPGIDVTIGNSAAEGQNTHGGSRGMNVPPLERERTPNDATNAERR